MGSPPVLSWPKKLVYPIWQSSLVKVSGNQTQIRNRMPTVGPGRKRGFEKPYQISKRDAYKATSSNHKPVDKLWSCHQLVHAEQPVVSILVKGLQFL
jgi:hypothetical protein